MPNILLSQNTFSTQNIPVHTVFITTLTFAEASQGEKGIDDKRRHVETPMFIDGLIQAKEAHDQFATDLSTHGKLRNTHH